ncbi:hypothetical protein DFH11DRAFT_1558066 [Phellopilus nigrolimitatus]|nr:hypothetical protein DFH11DRAFT_1558066 [Phellopilus nigrolimitatus]
MLPMQDGARSIYITSESKHGNKNLRQPTHAYRLTSPAHVFAVFAAVTGLIIAMFTHTNPFETSSDRVSSRFREFELPGSIGSSTYLPHSDVKFTMVSASPARNNTPDTTAVVLNWSRLENVVLISALLCGPWLSSTIAQVLIWNNNPNITLGMKNFRGTGCSAKKLRIHNSPSNIYFRARFIACAEAQTPFCFIQDDDYLIRPEIIQNMHAFFTQSPSIPSLHLLPAHEHLLSRLRTINTVDGLITTSFAWLGHGTFLSRSVANDFLNLLLDLEVDEEALKMADNYFTILANRPKQEEIWFDHGIELGGGQPFTVGPEGDARNDRHITQALTYLSTLVAGNAASSSPYISRPNISHTDVNMAPCRLASCLVKSNIELLPDYQRSEVRIAEDMVPEAQRQWRALGQEQTQWYMQNSLSTIVDGRSETAFHSREGMRFFCKVSMHLPLF